MRIKWSHSKYVGGFLVACVVVPVIGQWFIALADEKGLYRRPSALLGQMSAALNVLVASPWFHWIGGIVIGCTIGVWLV